MVGNIRSKFKLNTKKTDTQNVAKCNKTKAFEEKAIF